MDRRLFLPVLLIAALGCARSHEPLPQPVVSDFSYSNPSAVAVTHIDLDLDVDFDRRVIGGRGIYHLDNKGGADVVHLDTWALNIKDVTLEGGKQTRWALGDSVQLLGRPLSVAIGPEDSRIIITYQTTADARGIQWLTPAQTAGKQHPYVYTQSQTIHARSWLPCQDTPAQRFTYTATVRVPPGLLALMSANNPHDKNNDGVYRFEMGQPIPSYLMALAVGDIEYRALSERAGVYSEPSVVDKAAWEFADLEKMIVTAEAMYGPYRWDQYDVLVLPPSFRFGGVENPR
jgi:aminopeptidase N